MMDKVDKVDKVDKRTSTAGVWPDPGPAGPVTGAERSNPSGG